MSAPNREAQTLITTLERGINCDSWGQRLEAVDHYNKFVYQYNRSSTNYCSNNQDETRIGQIIECVKQRAAMLDNVDGAQGSEQVSLEALKTHLEDFKDITTRFHQNVSTRHPSVIETTGTNLLQPKPTERLAGFTYVSILIDRVGLKDADAYDAPYFSVKVREQNTPTCTLVKDKYLIFNMNVHLQKALEELPQDFAIFFELMHYKSKKDKVSCRCFAIVERDEIKNGIGTFELYKKPPDYNRRRLYLFTEKPLFLHLEFNVEKYKGQEKTIVQKL